MFSDVILNRHPRNKSHDSDDNVGGRHPQESLISLLVLRGYRACDPRLPGGDGAVALRKLGPSIQSNTLCLHRDLSKDKSSVRYDVCASMRVVKYFVLCYTV